MPRVLASGSVTIMTRPAGYHHTCSKTPSAYLVLWFGGARLGRGDLAAGALDIYPRLLGGFVFGRMLELELLGFIRSHLIKNQTTSTDTPGKFRRSKVTHYNIHMIGAG